MKHDDYCAVLTRFHVWCDTRGLCFRTEMMGLLCGRMGVEVAEFVEPPRPRSTPREPCPVVDPQFGPWVRRTREGAGIKQGRFAVLAGVSQAVVSRIEGSKPVSARSEAAVRAALARIA